MEIQTEKCSKHKMPNEIYCNACKRLICGQCLAEHISHNEDGDFIHVFDYAKSKIIPLLDVKLKSLKEEDTSIEKQSAFIITNLQELVPKLINSIEMQSKKVHALEASLARLNDYCSHNKGVVTAEAIINGINSDKENLAKAIKDKNSSETLKLSLKAEAELAQRKSEQQTKILIEQFISVMEKIHNEKEYDRAASGINNVLIKCNSLQILPYFNIWKCDRAYYSTKMYLSEDDLTFGNTASNGYPAIIGNLPFDSGLYAFEVIPTGLDCTKKEGFGIIEKSAYLTAFAKSNTTPEVYDDMIGFMYSKCAQNMEAIRLNDMVMDQKYYVKVNILEQYVIIFSQNLLLKAKLKPDGIYYPCFSCGCSGNRLRIRPLENYNEVEEPH